MSSTPSERDPDSGSGLIDRWLEHRSDPADAPEGSPPVEATPLVEPSGTIPGLPRSRQAVEADIQAALRPARGTTPHTPEGDPVEPGGRHVDEGADEMGGLDHEQRRERLARMLHSKIGVDPLTAPLSVVEGYADPAEEEPDGIPEPGDDEPVPPEGSADVALTDSGPPAVQETPGPTDSDSEPNAEPDISLTAAADRSPEAPPLPHDNAAKAPAPGAGPVDVFAALRESPSPKPSAPSAEGLPSFSPTRHDADAVVFSPLNERLATGNQTEPESTVPDPPITDRPIADQPVTDQPVPHELATDQPVSDPQALDVPVAGTPKPPAEPPEAPTTTTKPAASTTASTATTRPEESMKSEPSTGPEPSPITQLSAMFEPRWDTDEDEAAGPARGQAPGLDVGRRPTCSTEGAVSDSATDVPVAAERASTEAPATPTRTGLPQRIEFASRHATQRVLLALLLIAFVGLCLTGWSAWQDPTTVTIAVAVFFGVVTLVLWSAHSRAAPPKVVVENGVLTITRHEARHIFDLKSSYTPIEAVGTPGRRGWKVLITRRSMDPFVIDDSMVDPHEFTKVLEHYRPTDSP